jgi:hypothetical protein
MVWTVCFQNLSLAEEAVGVRSLPARRLLLQIASRAFLAGMELCLTASPLAHLLADRLGVANRQGSCPSLRRIMSQGVGGDGLAWYACPALVSLPTSLLHLCIEGDSGFDANIASTKRDTDLLDRAKLTLTETRGHKSQEPRSFAPRSEAPRSFASQGSFGGGKPGAFDARMLCHLGVHPSLWSWDAWVCLWSLWGYKMMPKSSCTATLILTVAAQPWSWVLGA